MSSAYFSTVTATDFLNAGRSVTGFDINGDGLGDLIIGADLAPTTSGDDPGQVLVLFGSSASGDFDSATVDLDTFAFGGTDGFIISGASSGDQFGWDLVNAGDQNGDGIDDLAIVSLLDDTVTVIFGRDSGTQFSDDIDLGGGPGSDGYVISNLGGTLDVATIAGSTDVGGSAANDLIIGVSGGLGSDTIHVVYGDSTSNDVDVSALNGTTGFSVTGLKLVNVGDSSASSGLPGEGGYNVGSLGNVDGSGIDDFLLGMIAPTQGSTPSGDLYILRGGTVSSATLNASTTSLTSTNSIVLTGLSATEATTASVAGNFDFNDDGGSDIIIGAADEGANGAVYVVFGGSGIADTVDLDSLDGTDGFKITGLAGDDGLGVVVQSLGDISGDGIDDLGILTRSGDLYVVYGDDAAFGATLDLSTLGVTSGFAITGLFDQTPSSLTLVGLDDINGDDINDISVGATFDFGETGETFVILGGSQNLANLDASDAGGADNAIDFATIGEVDFVETNGTFVVGGDNGDTITEDELTATGSISISDTSGDTTPTFADRTGTGQYGGLTVSNDGLSWTYTVNEGTLSEEATQAILQALNQGETLEDTVDVTATGTGGQTVTQTITITFTGIDDDAVFDGDLTPVISEDISQSTFAFSLTDVDDDDPSLANLRFDGTAGYIQFNAAGDAYTVFTTDPTLQGLSGAQTRNETITVTDSAGNTFDIDLTFTGADEGTPLNFDNDPNDIFTSFGDDIINALGGADNINPGAGDDTVNAGDGNDEVRDGLGDDTVNGEGDNDLIILLSGENTVDGGAGNDFIRTGYNSDTIDGGADDDVISADSGAVFFFGNDTVTGGTGNDIMKAGAGADTFVFRPNDGTDVIAEFDEAAVSDAMSGFNVAPSGAEFESGIDKISLVGFTTVDAATLFNPPDPMSPFMTEVGGSAVFSAEGTTITFFNVGLASLSIDDFIFS
ncbi:MAG: VCBS domain-containing protein [Pseudomonadota bacterium]